MIKDIFKVELYKVKLEGIDNHAISNHIEKNAKVEETMFGKGKNFSDVLDNELFKKLNEEVEKHFNILFHKNCPKEYCLKINQAWYNKGADELIIEPHKHQNSVYSAVYYPFSTDGKIVFQNPGHSVNNSIPPEIIKVWDEYIGDLHTENVRTGDLIIFKSGLFHWIQQSEFDRYSVAYNSQLVFLE